MRPEVDVYVCVTCQDGEERPGLRLHRTLEGMPLESIRLHAVECMSVCKRPCTVAVSAPGKWTYIIGDLDAVEDAAALLEYVDSYAADANGTPPLKNRPQAIRRGTIARLPPITQ